MSRAVRPTSRARGVEPRTRPSPVSRARQTWRVAAPAVCAVAMIGALTACSVPNLSMSRTVSRSSVGKTKPDAASSTTVSPTPSATPTTGQSSTTTPRVAGDLDTGSVTHKVAVGAFSAVIVYYTADDAKVYRDSSTKTVRVAAHIEGADSTQIILVNDFIATADDGVTRAIVKQDSRSFAITPPQSYNSVVTVPATADKSSAVTLIVEFDFSVQIAPTSTLYAAQTALDSITIPLLTGSQS